MKPRTQALEASGGQRKGGRPKLPSGQKRNCSVKVNFDRKNYGRLLLISKEAGKSLSETVYELAVNGYVKEPLSQGVVHALRVLAGMVDYANDIRNKKADIIASEGVDLTSNKSITASFSLQAKGRPSLKNFVGHLSLSFAPEDAPKLSNRLMADIANEYLRRMGIVNTQYIISRHHDKPHPHVHIVYNRVNNDGNAISGDQNFRKSARIQEVGTDNTGTYTGIRPYFRQGKEEGKPRPTERQRCHKIQNL